MVTVETRTQWALNAAEQSLAFWHYQATRNDIALPVSRERYCHHLDKVNELRALLDKPPVKADPRIN